MILAILNNFSGFVSILSKTESVYICICAQLVAPVLQTITTNNKYLNFSVDIASFHVDDVTAFEIKTYALFCENGMNRRSVKSSKRL